MAAGTGFAERWDRRVCSTRRSRSFRQVPRRQIARTSARASDARAFHAPDARSRCRFLDHEHQARRGSRRVTVVDRNTLRGGTPLIGTSRPWRSTHTSVRCRWSPPIASLGTYTSAPWLEIAKWAVTFTCATSSTSGTASPVTASLVTSKGTASNVPSSAYTRWPVGTYRASAPRSTTTSRLPLSSDWTTICAVSHSPRRASQREQDGAPTRQQLRTVGDLTGLDFHDVLRLSTFAGYAPDPRGAFPGALVALPVENRVVARPTDAKRVFRRTQHERRAAGDRDLLELAVLPEADPPTIW